VCVCENVIRVSDKRKKDTAVATASDVSTEKHACRLSGQTVIYQSAAVVTAAAAKDIIL